MIIFSNELTDKSRSSFCGILIRVLLLCLSSVAAFEEVHPDIRIHEHGLHVPKLNLSVPFNANMIPMVNTKNSQRMANGEASCFQFVQDIAATTLPAFINCLKDMELEISNFTNPKDVREFLPCLGRCMGIKLNVLNADGTPNIENARQLMKRLIPKRFMKFVYILWDTCEDDIMQIKSGDDGEDPNCESFRPGIRCVVNNGLHYAVDALKLCPDVPEAVKDFIERILLDKRVHKYLNKILY